MTEKRFRISQGYTDRFCHDWQNNQLLNFRETIELLNELADENKQLEKEIKKLKCINKQVEDRLENSGIGIALDMGECE